MEETIVLDLEVKTPIFSYTRAELETILSFYNRKVDDLSEDVTTLRKWLNQQPHLPRPHPNNRLLLNILIRNKFSIEKTKQKLDNYYTIRGLYPKYFRNRLPNGPDMIHMRRQLKAAFLPKLINYNRVILLYLDDPEIDFDTDTFGARLLIYAELSNLYDICHKVDVIIDNTNISMKTVKPINITFFKDAITIAEKIFSNRLNSLHMINLPPYAEAVFNLFKNMLPTKLKNRVFISKSKESLWDFFPKNDLPNEYGGSAGHFLKLSDDLENLAYDSLEHFKVFQNIHSNEALRPQKMDNDEVLGYHGNFRKLQVD